MDVKHKQDENKRLFYVEKENRIVAEMTYSLASTNVMIIDHTEVSDELRGLNIGYQLVHAAVEYARKQKIKIIPLCPFANAVFKKKPEFADVLK